jgi:thioredoxin-related protein
MKRIIIILLFAGIAATGFSQIKKVQPNWQDFSTTINATEQDKITMIYVYNNNSQWNCAATEETILADSTVIKALMKNFISVKFDSETKEDLIIKDKKYGYSAFSEESGVHVYAIVLLNGKMGFPTFVFLDKEGEKIGTHFPVKDAEAFLLILRYYSSGDYKDTPYEEWLQKQ